MNYILALVADIKVNDEEEEEEADSGDKEEESNKPRLRAKRSPFPAFYNVLDSPGSCQRWKSAYNFTFYFSRLVLLDRIFFLKYSLPLYPYVTLTSSWLGCSTYLE